MEFLGVMTALMYNYEDNHIYEVVNNYYYMFYRAGSW